jgi:hypothetical protein
MTLSRIARLNTIEQRLLSDIAKKLRAYIESGKFKDRLAYSASVDRFSEFVSNWPN